MNKAIQGYIIRVYRGIQGYTGVSKGIQGYARVYKGMQGIKAI